MPDLLEEKYIVASLLAKLDLFSLEDLKKEVRDDQVPIAVDVVVKDLLQRACIAESQHETFVFNPKTLDFSPTTKTIYTIIPEQRPALVRYIEELESQRFQPDAQGRPRGLHFRIVEGLLENVLANPVILLQEKEALTEYFALTQEEEMSEQLDPRQREISEAYIRILYGKFLALQLEWEEAVLHLLIASQLFKKHGVGKMQGDTENLACEICYRMYEESKDNQSIEKLSDTRLLIEKVKQTISNNNTHLLVFFSLLEKTSDIEKLISLLRRQKIDQRIIKSNVYTQEKEKTLKWLAHSKHRKLKLSRI